jgi:polyisoprenyl-phosphate glycosyltransferase
VERLLNEVREDDSYSYEFVFVDDHSTDTTPDKLLEVGESVKNLKVIRLGSNSGSHVACRAGLNYCDGDVAVFLTADLQEGPELIPGMLRLWNEGIDVVSTIAEKRDRESFLSNAFAKLYYFLVKHTGDLGYVRDVRASPRLLDRKVIERYCSYAPRDVNMGLWILQQKFHMDYLGYIPNPRRHGVSKWSFMKRLELAKNTLLEITPAYLVSWSWVGATFIGIGVLQCLRMIVGEWSIGGVGGLAALVLIVGGAILLGQGAIGTYMWRIYSDLRHGPEYNVQWSLNVTDRRLAPGAREERIENPTVHEYSKARIRRNK